MWVDNYAFDTFKPGDRAFLVCIHDISNGTTQRELRTHPAHTNASCEPRLVGWCGETNNISVHAEGAVRVTRRVKNPGMYDRILVRKLSRKELPDFLAAAGYPELNGRE